MINIVAALLVLCPHIRIIIVHPCSVLGPGCSPALDAPFQDQALHRSVLFLCQIVCKPVGCTGPASIGGTCNRKDASIRDDSTYVCTMASTRVLPRRHTTSTINTIPLIVSHSAFFLFFFLKKKKVWKKHTKKRRKKKEKGTVLTTVPNHLFHTTLRKQRVHTRQRGI